jgi:hypothetical protein
VSLLHTIDLNAGWFMLVERSPDTEQEGKVEQPPQGYTAKGEQPLGYDSDYASTYDYPTTEDTNGTLNMEAVCVIPSSFACIPFVRNWCLYTRFFNSRTQTITTKVQWNTNHTMDMNKKLWILRITISLPSFYVNR